MYVYLKFIRVYNRVIVIKKRARFFLPRFYFHLVSIRGLDIVVAESSCYIYMYTCI